MAKQVRRNRVDALPHVTTARDTVRQRHDYNDESAVPGVSIDADDESQDDIVVPPSGRKPRGRQQTSVYPGVTDGKNKGGRPVGSFVNEVKDKTGVARGPYRKAPKDAPVYADLSSAHFVESLNLAAQRAGGMIQLSVALNIPRMTLYRWSYGKTPGREKLSHYFEIFENYHRNVGL